MVNCKIINLCLQNISKIQYNIVNPMTSIVGKFYLSAAEVEYSESVILFGVPSVHLSKNRRIVIGNHEKVRSKSERNAIGINHEVILRTESESVVVSDNDFHPIVIMDAS